MAFTHLSTNKQCKLLKHCPGYNEATFSANWNQTDQTIIRLAHHSFLYVHIEQKSCNTDLDAVSVTQLYW